MGLKRKNWMMTVWGNEFPECIKDLENLIIAHTQKEITKNGKVHWQVFCQFNSQVTMASLRDYFLKKGYAAHIGSQKDKEIKTALQGVQYVHGYGPLALSKCLEANERYIIKPNEIIQTPINEEHLIEWGKYRDALILPLLEKQNEYLAKRILELNEIREKKIFEKERENGI